MTANLALQSDAAQSHKYVFGRAVELFSSSVTNYSKIHNHYLSKPFYRYKAPPIITKLYAFTSIFVSVINRQTYRQYPAGTWRKYNVASTSMQRHDVASTLKRRYIYVMCLLGSLITTKYAWSAAVIVFTSMSSMSSLSVRAVTECFALPTLNHEGPGSNPAGGGIQLMTARRFITYSLS